jgi:hypothetical protein
MEEAASTMTHEEFLVFQLEQEIALVGRIALRNWRYDL